MLLHLDAFRTTEAQDVGSSMPELRENRESRVCPVLRGQTLEVQE